MCLSVILGEGFYELMLAGQYVSVKFLVDDCRQANYDNLMKPPSIFMPKQLRRIVSILLLSIGLLGFIYPADPPPEDATKIIVVSIEGEIDLGMASYVRRIIERANSDTFSYVVLEINSPGGRLDAAIQIKDSIIESQTPVISFVNREAFSAGALIALASTRIFMAPGSVLGSAAPVDGQGVESGEKIVSAVRKEFKSLAELRGRRADVAEAMVDKSVEVEGLVASGKLLSLTAEEALEWGYSEDLIQNLSEIETVLDLDGAQLVYTSPTLIETLVRFFTSSSIAPLLISLGLLGIMIEFMSPGFGLAGVIGVLFLALFFWGHMLAGLAGWEGVILVTLGIVLLGIELLVAPGFGVVGVIGIGMFLSGIFISLVGEGSMAKDFQRAGFQLIQTFILVVVGSFLALKFLPKRRLFRGLVLNATMRTGHGIDEPNKVPSGDLRDGSRVRASASQNGPLYGSEGKALTDLNPSGVIVIGNLRVDVVTEGNFVSKGSFVTIIRDERYRRVVRKLDDQ